MYEKEKLKPYRIKCPVDFTIETGLEKSIVFLSRVRNFNGQNYSHVYLDLNGIKKIDIVCIVMLLSVVNHLSSRNISVVGNHSGESISDNIFCKSGFLSHMTKISGGKFTSSDEHSLIVKIGTDKANPDLIGKTNAKAVKILTGREFHYKKLNSMVGEMAGNTMEFAYSHNKHYLYCYNYTGGDEITFVFSDVGYGIIDTLRKNVGHIINDTITFKDKLAVLNGAFDKKYGSKTEEVNRNQGLPLIKSVNNEGLVKNLRVLTNGVYLDFDDNEKSQILSNRYSGTIYVWKVSKSILEEYLS
jgi:hypothetical protein